MKNFIMIHFNIRLRIIATLITHLNSSHVKKSNFYIFRIFRQMDLMIQGTLISSATSTNHPYRAYLETLLESKQNKSSSYLQSGLFILDSANYHDKELEKGKRSGNHGLVSRYFYTSNDKVAEMEGVLINDLSQVGKYILNGVGIRLKLFPAPDSFVILSADNIKYELHIVDCVLKVCLVEPNSSIIVGHSSLLKKSIPATYPYMKTDIRTVTIPKGFTSWSCDDLFNDSIPAMLCCAFVDSAAYNGDYSKNPFNLQHYNCSELAFYTNGILVNGLAYKPNFEDSHYTDCYLSLFQDDQNTEENIISRKDFGQGYSLFVWRPSAGIVQDEYITPIRKGHTRLSITWKVPLPEAVTIILMSKYPHSMQFDEARNLLI